MPNIAAIMKSEISRIARKEIRAETESIKKSSSQYRSQIAVLKRQVASLEKLLRQTSKGTRAAPAGHEAEESSTSDLRFRAKGFGAHRKRLGLSAAQVGALIGVSGQTIYHWEGLPCIGFEEEPPAKQEIACTRSFGRAVTRLADLTEAVTEFSSRAAEKLRRQEGVTGQVLVFVRTSPFRVNDKQYSRSMTVPLRRPTSDSASIAQGALLGLNSIYRPGFNYAKAGVMLLDLRPGNVEQRELDLGDAPSDRRPLMGALDRINDRYGRGTLLLASTGNHGARGNWVMKQERRTPRYTTHWDEMATART